MWNGGEIRCVVGCVVRFALLCMTRLNIATVHRPAAALIYDSPSSPPYPLCTVAVAVAVVWHNGIAYKHFRMVAKTHHFVYAHNMFVLQA